MASNLTHTWTTQIKNDSGAAVSADPPLVILGDAEINFSVQVPATQTVEVDQAIDTTKIVSGFVGSDLACDVWTNSTTNGQHIQLAAKKAYSWNDTQPASCPFTPTITKIYVVNSGSSMATVRGGFLLQE